MNALKFFLLIYDITKSCKVSVFSYDQTNLIFEVMALTLEIVKCENFNFVKENYLLIKIEDLAVKKKLRLLIFVNGTGLLYQKEAVFAKESKTVCRYFLS